MNSTTTLFGHLPQMNSTFLLYVLKLQNCYLTKAEKKKQQKNNKKKAFSDICKTCFITENMSI